MKILHINNGYCDSKVHMNLTRELDNLGIQQIVYCPVRDAEHIDKNRIDGRNTEFVYSLCIKSWYRYVYHYKQWKLYRDMKARIDLGEISYIHAHTLFSDGGLAYKAYRKFGIKYSVAIRNTDLNQYIRLLKHTYHLGREILLHADKIIFISTGIKSNFEQTKFITPILDRVKDKFIVLPNGIDAFWLDNISKEPRAGRDILYVGDFSANKNVVRLAEAVLALRSEPDFHDLRLIIVGGEVKGGDRENDGRTQQMIDANPEAIKALGKIYEKDKLSEVMRSCSLFAMTSIFETFGLVYIEALSQNLPVIYTKGQGIDGMFDETVGIGVDAFSVDESKDAIRKILLNHDKYGNMAVDFNDFDWKMIAKKYLSIYEGIV